jgi:manganese-dependent inorganic pyrophosphatase
MKEFYISGKKLGVSQMMVLDCEEIDIREAELLEELERLRILNSYDLAALLVTNPLSSANERILMKGEKWLVEKAFNLKFEGDVGILPGVLRKRFYPAIGQVPAWRSE